MNKAQTALHPRLSMMMFMQYAVLGIWMPFTIRYLSATTSEGGLGFSGTEIGWMMGLAGSLGAICSPFIAGQLADRHFSTEKFIAFLLGIGGLLQWTRAFQTNYTAWLIISIIYGLSFTPTVSLSNSLSFSHLKSARKDFPKIRVWGTIGWIAGGWIFPMVWLQTGLKFQLIPPFLVGQEFPDVTARLVDCLKFSGTISIIYAVYCWFVLPHTPPRKDAVEKLAFKKALGLLKNKAFLVLVICHLAIGMIHQVYYFQTPPFFSSLGLRDSLIAPAMTICQFSEIFFMASLGLFLKRFGYKRVLFAGAFSFFIRYLLFGSTDLPMSIIILSQVFHGICFAGFYGAAFIFVDKIAEEDFRHSAQTVFSMIAMGGGPILGGWLSGFLERLYTPVGGTLNYSMFWYTCAGIGLVASIGFWIFFNFDEKKT